MILKNDRELACSHEKLRELEDYFQRRSKEAAPDPHLRELTLRSLKRLIVQMKEDIARYEVRRPASALV